MALAIIFDSVGFGEWFILLAVVLIVVGPRRLPSVARTLGQYYSRFRRAADNFKRQLMDMETEFDKGVAEVERSVSPTVQEPPYIDGMPGVEDTPSVEDSPAVEEPPYIDGLPSVEETSDVEDTSKSDEASKAEESPKVDTSAGGSV